MLPGSEHEYLRRYIDEELDALLPSLHGIAIDGPKGVGKTVTASRRANRTFRVDEESSRNLLISAGKQALTSAPTVLIDEWQHYPPLWDSVRRLIDAQVSTHFLFTGSASPITNDNTHSGAGRIISLRLRPLALSERAGTQPRIFINDIFEQAPLSSPIHGESSFSYSDYAQAICATGFPQITQLPPRARRASIDGYIARLVDRDLPEQGIMIRRPSALRAWLTAYAGATATTASYTKILAAALPNEGEQPSKSAANNYRSLLEKLWILDPLPAWLPTYTPLTRLSKAAKHHLADPGLAAYLMGVSEDTLTSGQPGTAEIFGQLFESLMLLTLRAAAGASEAKTYHFRSKSGEHEVDAILERYDGKVIAFEAKSSALVEERDVKHLNWLGAQLGSRLLDKIVVYTGQYAYRRPDGVAVIPLALLG